MKFRKYGVSIKNGWPPVLFWSMDSARWFCEHRDEDDTDIYKFRDGHWHWVSGALERRPLVP